MKLTNRIFAIIALMLFIISCDSQNESMVMQGEIQPKFSDTHKIPITEAMADLQNFLDEIEPKSKGYGKRVISGIEYVMNINSLATKSTKDTITCLADTLLYIINFDNDNGFAVLSADDRIAERILAVTDYGELHADDFIFNSTPDSVYIYSENGDSTLFNFYSNSDDDYYVGADTTNASFIGDIIGGFADDAANTSTDTYGNTGQTTPISGNYDGLTFHGKNSDVETYVWRTTQSVAPMLTTLWNQQSPFNDLCPMRGWFHKAKAPTGCVPTALAQIMAYNKIPEKLTINDISCNWDTIRTVRPLTDRTNLGTINAKLMVSQLLMFIGLECNAVYAKDWAFATPESAKRCLSDFGYQNVRKHIGYDESQVISMLDLGNPVFIAAISGVKDGHAWVIDGYIKRSLRSEKSDVEISTQTLLHCNWGWKGKCNGYYASGIFNVKKGAIISDGTSVDNGEKTEKCNFDWWYRILTYND